jgi:hypothetical protein
LSGRVVRVVAEQHRNGRLSLSGEQAGGVLGVFEGEFDAESAGFVPRAFERGAPRRRELLEGAGGAGLFGAGVTPRFADLSEEVVALVVDEDEGGEVFDFDLPNGFHSELRVFED